MKGFLYFAVLAFTALSVSPVAYGADKSDKYQLGIFVRAGAVADGTITDNFNCGSETLGSAVCSGGIQSNAVIIYRLRVTGGVWNLETMREWADSTDRQYLGQEPLHFTKEKENPLDLLKTGDRVLFRLEVHKRLLGTITYAYIPFADKPDKEAKFLATFVPDFVPPPPQRPSDNVRAMCAAHKLSPDLEKQFCTPAPEPTAPAANLQTPANSGTLAPSSNSTADPGEADHSLNPQELAHLVQSGLASWCGVYTTPSGAEVYVDGKKVGVAPMGFVLLKHGDTPRVVTIKMDGYKTIERQVIPDGKPIPLGLTLETQ